MLIRSAGPNSIPIYVLTASKRLGTFPSASRVSNVLPSARPSSRDPSGKTWSGQPTCVNISTAGKRGANGEKKHRDCLGKRGPSRGATDGDERVWVELHGFPPHCSAFSMFFSSSLSHIHIYLSTWSLAFSAKVQSRHPKPHPHSHSPNGFTGEFRSEVQLFVPAADKRHVPRQICRSL